MVGSDAIVYRPDADSVKLVNLGAKSLSGVTDASDQSPLTVIAKSQSGGVTSMEFKVTTAASANLKLTEGADTNLIYAYDDGNTFGFHNGGYGNSARKLSDQTDVGGNLCGSGGGGYVCTHAHVAACVLYGAAGRSERERWRHCRRGRAGQQLEAVLDHGNRLCRLHSRAAARRMVCAERSCVCGGCVTG